MRQNGFITLIAIVVVAALGFTLALTVLFSGIDTTLSSEVRRNGAQARALADACVEAALQEINTLVAYTGSDILNFGTAGSCTYSVALQGGQGRIIQATGTAGNAMRKIQVTVDQVAPSISISSYQDISDF